MKNLRAEVEKRKARWMRRFETLYIYILQGAIVFSSRTDEINLYTDFHENQSTFIRRVKCTVCAPGSVAHG